MQLLRTALLSTLSLAALASEVRADEIYTNLTTPGGYHVSLGQDISGTQVFPSAVGLWAASRFVTSEATRLDSIELPVIAAGSPGSEFFTVSLYDDAGGVPGIELENLGVHTALPNIAGFGLVKVTSAMRPVLDMGQFYWVVCHPASSATQVRWHDNSLGFIPYAFTSTGTWNPVGNTQPAVRVRGTSQIATYAYDNFTAAGSYAKFTGEKRISGVNHPQGYAASATRFTVTQDRPLSGVDLGLGNHNTTIDDVRVALYSDAFDAPGALIEDLGVISGFPTWGSTTTAMASIASTTGTVLTAGTPYWIVCSPELPDTAAIWCGNETGALGTAFQNLQGWFGNTLGLAQAMRVSTFGDPYVSYCTAGTSANGCQATLAAVGTPCANASGGFVVSATNVEGGKDGLFFYGVGGRQANAWGDGSSFQCVVPPVKRAGLLTGSGSSGACDGSFSQDLNALWASSPSKNPGQGAVVQLQVWYRDPFSTSNQTTSLSDALEFTVQP